MAVEGAAGDNLLDGPTGKSAERSSWLGSREDDQCATLAYSTSGTWQLIFIAFAPKAIAQYRILPATVSQVALRGGLAV